MMQYRRWQVGMTLVELLTVLAIMAVLTIFLVESLSDSSAQSRDAERQADIRSLQTAIELYRQEHGRYPEGCNGANNWSGERGGAYECADGGAYIVNLAPKYIRTLPTDPKRAGDESGYVYRVNSAGTVYKLIVFQSVEELRVANTSGAINQTLRAFQLCDTDGVSADPNLLCQQVHPANNNPPHCRGNSPIYQSSYAVWGGYDSSTNNTILQERRTEAVVCSIPPTT